MKLENFKKKSVIVAMVSFIVLLGKTYGIYDVPEK